jgi:hypothetical protein
MQVRDTQPIHGKLQLLTQTVSTEWLKCFPQAAQGLCIYNTGAYVQVTGFTYTADQRKSEFFKFNNGYWRA